MKLNINANKLKKNKLIKYKNILLLVLTFDAKNIALSEAIIKLLKMKKIIPNINFEPKIFLLLEK